jgi:hypothetical protein
MLPVGEALSSEAYDLRPDPPVRKRPSTVLGISSTRCLETVPRGSEWFHTSSRFRVDRAGRARQKSAGAGQAAEEQDPGPPIRSGTNGEQRGRGCRSHRICLGCDAAKLTFSSHSGSTPPPAPPAWLRCDFRTAHSGNRLTNLTTCPNMPRHV